VAGVVGADGKGGRDMLCASLSGAGRKGGTPRPLSNGGWTGLMAAGRKSESDCSAFDVSGTTGSLTGSGPSIESEDGSSGLRRLNKTLYQTERGASAYHGVRPANNSPFKSPALIDFQTGHRPDRSAAARALSRTWTIDATPIIGTSKFRTGT
jgi:hypothetical protein